MPPGFSRVDFFALFVAIDDLVMPGCFRRHALAAADYYCAYAYFHMLIIYAVLYAYFTLYFAYFAFRHTPPPPPFQMRHNAAASRDYLILPPFLLRLIRA